jgi:hypothetical protein
MRVSSKLLIGFVDAGEQTQKKGSNEFDTKPIVMPIWGELVKTVLTLFLLCVVSTAVASPEDCATEFQVLENVLAPMAEKLTEHPMIVKVIMTDLIPAELGGLADSRNSRILINPLACTFSHISKLSLLAHETGHLVAHALWSNIREDSYSGANKIGVGVHEGLADEYASKILSALGRLDDAINMLIPVCDASTRITTGQDFNAYSRTACAHLAIFRLEQRPVVLISEHSAIIPPHG